MTPPIQQKENRCPVCGSSFLDRFLELKPVPVNCSILWPDRRAALAASRAPMRLMFCCQCTLIFNALYDPQKLSYDDSYDSSLDFSQQFQAFLVELVHRLIGTYSLRKKRITEIGSGQGSFLRLICEMGGNDGIGYDPTYKCNRGWVGEGSVTFVQALYQSELEGAPADFTCFRHVLEHLSDPAAFLQDLRRAYPKGSNQVIYCEVPNGEAIFGGQPLWDIVYQHVSYFTAPALKFLFESSGFRILDMRTSYGGQFLSVEAAPSEVQTPPSPIARRGVAKHIASFQRRFGASVDSWQTYVNEACLEGRRLALWGCGSKGVTFLNVVPGAERIQFVTDVNPHKHGMYVPGTGQRIVSPEELKTIRPDTVIVPNPLYKDEVARSLAALMVPSNVLTVAASAPCMNVA
jgi:hypothetical protein